MFLQDAKLPTTQNSGGSNPGALPHYGPKFSQFHAVFGKILQNRMLAPPPGGLASPPTRNPGSAPAKDGISVNYLSFTSTIKFITLSFHQSNSTN